MEYLEFCKAMGLAPNEEVRRVYDESEDLLEPLDLCWINRLMPQTGAEVRLVADAVSADTLKLRYINLVKACYWTVSKNDVPFLPQGPGKAFENLAPVLVLLSFVDQSEKEMCRRGIPEEMRLRVHSCYENTLLMQKNIFGYSVMPAQYFFWFKRRLIPTLYEIGDMEFELKTMTGETVVYLEKETGKYLGFLENSETENSFICTEILRGGTPGKTRILSKEGYCRYLRAGDEVISVHIPQGAKIGQASVSEKFAQARDFFARYYSDHTLKCFYCGSWLMDPTLADYLRPTSNIVTFQRMFYRYCASSTGQEVFGFVHPAPFDSYEDLPENTSLERMLKERYINGNPVYVYSGICPFE